MASEFSHAIVAVALGAIIMEAERGSPQAMAARRWLRRRSAATGSVGFIRQCTPADHMFEVIVEERWRPLCTIRKDALIKGFSAGIFSPSIPLFT